MVLRVAKVRVAEESRAQAGGGLEELGGSEGESDRVKPLHRSPCSMRVKEMGPA